MLTNHAAGSMLYERAYAASLRASANKMQVFKAGCMHSLAPDSSVRCLLQLKLTLSNLFGCGVPLLARVQVVYRRFYVPALPAALRLSNNSVVTL
jgi:hypothetical protein